MNKRTRLILSIIGVGALVVPVILLLVVTGRGGKQSQPVDESSRQIDTKNVEDAVRRQAALASPLVSPTPAATASAAPTPESTSSGQ